MYLISPPKIYPLATQADFQPLNGTENCFRLESENPKMVILASGKFSKDNSCDTRFESNSRIPMILLVPGRKALSLLLSTGPRYNQIPMAIPRLA